MCLKRLNYDRKELERRREETQHEIKGQHPLSSSRTGQKPPRRYPGLVSLLSLIFNPLFRAPSAVLLRHLPAAPSAFISWPQAGMWREEGKAKMQPEHPMIFSARFTAQDIPSLLSLPFLVTVVRFPVHLAAAWITSHY